MDNTTPYASVEYDVSVRKTIPYYEVFHRETASLVKTIKPSVSTWLDTGCGTGFLTESASRDFPDCSFILADPSKGMLDVCKARLRGRGNVRFIEQCGSESLPLDALSNIEVITAIQSHHYLDETTRKKATANCFTLLARGGLYITFENIKPDTDAGIGYGLDRWAGFLSSVGQSDEFVKDHRNRFGKAYFPITVREHLALLRDTGFAAAELFWFSYMQAGFYAIK